MELLTSFDYLGLDSHLVYPNGISNTMPEDIQLNFLRMIPGLENVDMVKPGTVGIDSQ